MFKSLPGRARATVRREKYPRRQPAYFVASAAARGRCRAKKIKHVPEITFFTPTYRNDAQRFQLLRESIRRYYRGKATHVIAIPHADEGLFRRLTQGDDVQIVFQDDLVDKRFYPAAWYTALKRLLPSQAWRFDKFAGRNGWIIHIIVKLSINQFIKDKPAVLLDSDSFFTRPFSAKDLDSPADQRVLVKWIMETPIPGQQRHLRRTREILGAPEGSMSHNYQSNPEIWYPDWVEKLQNHLEKKYAKPWQEALFDAGTISSSALYGTYVDEIIHPEDLKVRGPFPYFIAWDEQSYESFLRNPRESIGDNFYAVIQSNLGHAVDEYRDLVVRDIFERDSATPATKL